jgi:hypothetical protein
MTKKTNEGLGELVELFDGSKWKIYRQGAGMGEYDYAVFLNGVFFCKTEHRKIAHNIVKAVRALMSFDLCEEDLVGP